MGWLQYHSSMQICVPGGIPHPKSAATRVRTCTGHGGILKRLRVLGPQDHGYENGRTMTSRRTTGNLKEGEIWLATSHKVITITYAAPAAVNVLSNHLDIAPYIWQCSQIVHHICSIKLDLFTDALFLMMQLCGWTRGRLDALTSDVPP